MTDIAFTIRGTRSHEDGSTTDIDGTVSEPKQIGEASDWLCTVRCAGLFPDEPIKGASAAQALHLSRLFLLDALDSNGIVVAEADKRSH